MDFPDYIEPIIGFKVIEFNGAGADKLTSPYREAYEWWPNRGTLKAECTPLSAKATRNTHPAPTYDCHCGYYAYYTLEAASNTATLFKTAAPLRLEFVSLVAAWGEVILHDTGLRAEYMEILALHNGPYSYKHKLQSAAEGMGVPFLNRNELEDYARERGTVFSPEMLD